MSAGWGPEHDAPVDPVGMLLIAIGSLACLEVAAHNLRGEARRPRRAATARPRR